MRYFIFLGLLAFSLCSCKSLLTKYYGMNKKMDFKNSEDYINYIEKKKKIDRSYLLIPDSSSYSRFLDTIISHRRGYYYGSYLNDTVSIRRSEFLKDNVTCMGRVLDNIEQGLHSMEKQTDSLFEFSKFSNFDFYEGSTGKLYNINQSSKPLKIYLLYYFQTGKAFDKSFKEIFEFADKHQDQIELKVIATDRIAVKGSTIAKQQANPSNSKRTVGSVSDSKNLLAELYYVAEEPGDTTYVILYNNFENRESTNFKFVQFKGTTGTIETLYHLMKAAFKPENENNADFSLPMTIGDYKIKLGLTRLKGITHLVFYGGSGYFYLTEKQVDQLFGKS